MKNGSSPGCDGLMTEFYKTSWQYTKEMLLESFERSFEVGHVSQTQKRGIITLIHKGNNLPRDSLANWRPITLLNTDYKILAKALARRLNTVLTKLIANDQRGFIKGRNIGTIIRTTDDVINYTNSKQLPGLLVAVDFTKAFDTISKKLIIDSLKPYGFGPDFIHWVSTLITQAESCTTHYGWTSEPFQVERGIRQGCPFSPLIFVLAVKLLAHKIRNSNIKGIKMGIENPSLESIIKIQQFADDTTLYLQDENDLETTLNIFGSFAKISGLRINKHKTEAMWLGRYKGREDRPHSLKWVRQAKILGVYFRNDLSACQIEENWTSKTEKLKKNKKTIAQWSRRNLSIYGKIVIAKTFLISQFIYIMQSIGLPNNILHNINRALYSFLWKKNYNNKKKYLKK